MIDYTQCAEVFISLTKQDILHKIMPRSSRTTERNISIMANILWD